MNENTLYEGSIRQEKDRLIKKLQDTQENLLHCFDDSPRIVRWIAKCIITIKFNKLKRKLQ